MLNPIYLQKANQEKIKTIFHQNTIFPSITLPDFFAKKEYQGILHTLKRLAYKPVVEPLHCRLKKAQLPKEIKDMLKGEEVQQVLSAIFTAKKKIVQTEVYKMTWKDYTVLYDAAVETSGIDVVIDCTDTWSEAWGGILTYTDGSGNSITIPPSKNTFIIVDRKKQAQKFIQYCNHYSRGKERLLVMCSLR